MQKALSTKYHSRHIPVRIGVCKYGKEKMRFSWLCDMRRGERVSRALLVSVWSGAKTLMPPARAAAPLFSPETKKLQTQHSPTRLRHRQRRERKRERDRDIKREKKAHDLFWPTPRQWARSLIFWPNQTDSPQNDFHATSTQLPTPLLKTPQITQMRFVIETKTPL